MKIPKKERRTSILYARVTPRNMEWVKRMMKQYRYKSLSEFIDTMLYEGRIQRMLAKANSQEAK